MRCNFGRMPDAESRGLHVLLTSCRVTVRWPPRAAQSPDLRRVQAEEFQGVRPSRDDEDVKALIGQNRLDEFAGSVSPSSTRSVPRPVMSPHPSLGHNDHPGDQAALTNSVWSGVRNSPPRQSTGKLARHGRSPLG